MALCTQKINPGFRRSCRKLIFRSFSGHPEGFGGRKLGPFLISVLCASGSGVGRASLRGREAWVSPRPLFLDLSPSCANGKGWRAHLPQLALGVQLFLACCLPFGPAAVDVKGVCVHAAERGSRHLYMGVAVGLWCLGQCGTVAGGCLGELRLSVSG